MPASEPITDASVLADHCRRWQTAAWLALDTEFLREDSYYPKLCLIQVGDGRDEACIDALALSAEDLAPLWALLRKRDSTKVFHAASQDLEIFVRALDGPVSPLADTQIAAALLGLGDQLGYAALVKLRTGVELDKSLTRTDWSRRPLSAAELDYAAADVRHLAEIYPGLLDALDAASRREWFEEDCARLADPGRYRIDPAEAWTRLRGLFRLPPAAQSIAVALAAWREVQAQARDRPRKWILDDEALYLLAERAPASEADLGRLEVLPPKLLARQASALLTAIEAGRGQPPPPLGAALDDGEKARLKRLQSEVNAEAQHLAISASVLAPRAELEALVRRGAEAPVQVLRGWRRAVVGERLLARL